MKYGIRRECGLFGCIVMVCLCWRYGVIFGGECEGYLFFLRVWRVGCYYFRFFWIIGFIRNSILLGCFS